jgi:MFS family permease
MISSFLVPRISDYKYGRRKPYLMSLMITMILYIMMFLSNSIYFNIIYFLGIGLCSGGRVCVGLSYMNEFIEERYHNLTTTIFLLGDSSLMLY